MKVTAFRLITIVLAALTVSACAGLRPESDPMAFAGSPSAPAPSLSDSLSFSVNFDAALGQAQDLRRHGDFDSAARVLGQLVIAAPNDARVIGEYGKVLLESGHTDDAVAFLERAVSLKDGHWTLFSALGVAYDQTGKPEAARAAFNHALALKPGEPGVLSNLALSHIQSGELDDAERLLLQASEQKKDVPGLADKLAMVRSLRGSAPAVSPAAQGPIPQPEPDMQPPAPVVAPLPIAPTAQPAENSVDEEPATPHVPETETVAATMQAPIVAASPPSSAATAITPAAQAPVGTATVSTNAVRPPARAAAPRQSAQRPPVARKATLAPPPVEAPRPTGVARAVTRTAAVPLVVTTPPESWESLVRVSLPPPSADLTPPDVAVPAGPPAAPEHAQLPSGWYGTLEGWGSAVLGFINQLWVRVFPERDAGTG